MVTWSFDSSVLRISIDRWLRAHDDARTTSEWEARGWRDGSWLAIPLRDWLAAGQPPRRGDEDAAQLEAWRDTHDRLARLVGLDGQVVAFRSVGHLQAPSFQIEVSVDGGPLLGEPACEALLRNGLPLAPSTALALSLAHRVVAASGDERYRELYGLQQLRERLADLPEALVRIDLDEHLSSIKVQAAERLSLGWVAEGTGQVVTLGMDAVLPSGERVAVDIGHLNRSGSVLTADAKAPIVLPTEVAQLLPVVKARKREPRRKHEAEFVDPALVLPEGVDFDSVIDLSAYADRVAGFEQVQRRTPAPPQSGAGIEWFAAPDPEFFLSVEARTEQGKELLRLQTRGDAEAFASSARSAVAAKHPTFSHAGRVFEEPQKALAVVEPLLQATTDSQTDAAATEETAERPGRWAAVLHELHADADDPDGVQVDEHLVPWKELEGLHRPHVALKTHQRRGIAWMWGHLTAGTRGVLLGDDMGLGKTLQVASLLALARRAQKRPQPHLVVCPAVLLENWARELENFFAPEVFAPSLVLHGDALRRFKIAGGLDVDRLANHSIVVTNYETLAAHQLSLLRIDWDIVVFDEAHWLKNETTLRARGAAGLKRRFGVAMTGTPVENKLSDVWAIFDTLEHRPPRTFGTRAEFVSQFEKEGSAGIDGVRHALEFPSKRSRLLRREKAQALRELPPKIFHELPVAMSPQQFEYERTLLSQRKGRSALQLIQQLQFLYQHPLLLSKKDAWSYSAEELVEMSPKLAKTCEQLEGIRARGERAIVFTQFKRMQDILVRVLRERLRLNTVPVINGDEHNRQAAQANLEWFMRLEGFGVMVLSPLAAGVGLTITSANHVIHYGRWWNPAKEEQATDRTHRIGQSRTVHVYFPTLHHPGDPSRGFDRKLHELVEKKRAVARDFLRPMDELELGAGEFENLCDTEAKQ